MSGAARPSTVGYAPKRVKTEPNNSAHLSVNSKKDGKGVPITVANDLILDVNGQLRVVPILAWLAQRHADSAVRIIFTYDFQGAVVDTDTLADPPIERDHTGNLVELGQQWLDRFMVPSNSNLDAADTARYRHRAIVRAWKEDHEDYDISSRH